MMQLEVLSSRELEVVRHAAEGLTMHQTARTMYLAPSTVKAMRYNAMRKLGAQSMTQAVAMLFRLGELE